MPRLCEILGAAVEETEARPCGQPSDVTCNACGKHPCGFHAQQCATCRNYFCEGECFDDHTCSEPAAA